MSQGGDFVLFIAEHQIYVGCSDVQGREGRWEGREGGRWGGGTGTAGAQVPSLWGWTSALGSSAGSRTTSGELLGTALGFLGLLSPPGLLESSPFNAGLSEWEPLGADAALMPS